MKNESNHKNKAKQGRRIRLVAVFAIGIMAGLILEGYFYNDGKCMIAASISQQQASEKALTYINSILQGQAAAKMVSMNESSGLYAMNVDVGGKRYNSFMTKDGKILFPSGINLETAAQAESSADESIPKSDKPKAELFVMSFCPYGVQAETQMKPVADLLGSKVDMKVRFIAQSGSDANSVQSLHGPAEAREDLRQLCIMKDYPEKYWPYLENFNKNCYPVYRNESALDTCWKSSAASAGIDAVKIESCVNSDSLALIKADEQAASAYGVSGSPTLIINGATYNGARSSEGFKNAICSAFNNLPAECNQEIGDSTQTVNEAPHAGCG